MRMEGRKRAVVKKENDSSEEKMVDLSGRSLDSLAISPALNLATVTKLDLSNNNIEAISESVTARLVNVVELDVRSNQLKALPNSIGCLSKLKILNVSGNLLDSLPNTIQNCRSLEELTANFNKLTSLPDTIGFELTNLRKLAINSNKLPHLPPSTSHMLTLRSLDARLNCLRTLPDGLENLTQLQSLDVSQNFHYLTSLPYAVGLLSSLSFLDISYNAITSLPDSLGCLANLKTLKTEGNPLVRPPKDVVGRGVEAVKAYLSARMNGDQGKKKRSWVGRLVRYGSTSWKGSGRRMVGDEELLMEKYHGAVQGFATPMRQHKSPMWSGMSPRRLFGSPKSK